MKKAALLSVGLLISVCVLAQSFAIDSMKRMLTATSNVDTNKAKICMQLSNEWLKVNIDSALFYADKSYDLALSLGLPLYQADARALQAKVQRVNRNYSCSYERSLEALHKYTRQNNVYGMGSVNLELGKTFVSQDDFPKALLYFKKALIIYNQAGIHQGLALAHIEIGIAYSKLHEPVKAIASFQKAAEETAGIADRSLSVRCYHLLAKEFTVAGEHNKSLLAAGRAKNLALISGWVPDIAESHLLLGKAYSKLNRFDSALASYNSSLSYFNHLHDKENIAKAYDGIGEVYYLQKDFSRATQFIKLSNQYAHDLQNKNLLQENYDALMSIAKASGDYKLATEYFDEIIALKDNINDNEKNASIANIRASFDLEKKQAFIAELQEDNLNKTRQRNFFISGFSMVALLLVGLGYTIYHLRNKKIILEQQKKELEELNLVKDRFFSIIGHDLRSPMANILGVLQLLSDEHMLSPAEIKQLFESLRFSTSSALETMDNILAWGLNQIKDNQTDTREVDMQEVTQRVCRFLQQTAENKSVRIINHVNEPVKILADKNHVEFILRNLVSNALKFTHKNGVVELWASSGKGLKNIHIKDTGTGMSVDQKHKLFDNSKKSSMKGTAGETGTGLGLFLSKQFITKNKGSISVKSEQGKGSVFTVTLPQAGN